MLLDVLKVERVVYLPVKMDLAWRLPQNLQVVKIQLFKQLLMQLYGLLDIIIQFNRVLFSQNSLMISWMLFRANIMTTQH